MPESVQVLFDYEYDTAEGKRVSIHRGDTYQLLAKSTEEWWKVKREDKEKLYVPANYVRVVETPPAVPDKLLVTHYPLSIKTDIPDTIPNGHGRHDDDSYQTDSGHGTLTPSASPDTRSAIGTNGSGDDIQYMNAEMLRLDIHTSAASTPSVSSVDISLLSGILFRYVYRFQRVDLAGL